MTKHKARKKLVRQRAAKTGESYAAALRQLRASKETRVTSPETTTDPAAPARRCALCHAEEGPTVRLVVVGHRLCTTCEQKVRAVLVDRLQPIADAGEMVLDYYLNAYVVQKLPDRWKVDLHTFRPGPVIGRRGTVAEQLRADLVAVFGDERLQLNIQQHFPDGRCHAEADTAGAP